MPELPDVEHHRRTAERHVSGRTIRAVHTGDPAVLRNTSPQGLGRAVTGAEVGEPRRTGKWLLLPTDAASDMIVHFGMTGAFVWLDGADAPGPYDHVRLQFDHGTLALRMSRKFGGLWIARSAAERGQITGPLGPDASRIDADGLRARLSASRAGVKSALMDQRTIAGVGNLLADEVCWQARIHPSTVRHDIAPDGWAAVAGALTRVLDVGVELGRVPANEGFLTDVRDDDLRCPRCGAPLRSSTIAGRTSVWCPRDQPPP